MTLYWGSTDGGTDAANWTHTNAFPGAQSPGTLSATLSGLPPRTAYSYRFMASNSVATIWTPAATFQTLTDFGPWSQKAPITASGYNRTETLTNFPMLVVLGPSIQGFSYSQFQSGSNADLVFSDGVQSNELNYEIETWNTNGLSYVWVQVPLLTNNATIWAFWGRSGLSTPAYTTNGAAWDGNYLGAGTWRRPTRRTPRTTSSTERWLDR